MWLGVRSAYELVIADSTDRDRKIKKRFKSGNVENETVAHRAELRFNSKIETRLSLDNTIEMNMLYEQDSSIESASQWWAVYTRHQHEKTVAHILTTKGFETFLPLYNSVRKWRDRNKTLSLPLFPCYVFVRGGLTRRLQVLTTPGVHTILYNGERIAIIPSGEIEAVQRVINSPSHVEPHPFLRCGETVRVTRGSLEGVEGVLVRKKSLYRLVLSVEMLAQSVAVEIDAADVVPSKERRFVGVHTRAETAGIATAKELPLYAAARQGVGAMIR